jgi:hypothetical protein
MAKSGISTGTRQTLPKTCGKNAGREFRHHRTPCYCPNMSEHGQFQTPARLNVSQAAKAVRKARSTINRDIDHGKVSVTRNGKGQPFIEVAELERVYGTVNIETVTEPVPIGHYGTPKNDNSDSALIKEIELLRERLADKDSVIDDLRGRLDAETEARRIEGEERRKLTALLTDQRVAADLAESGIDFAEFLLVHRRVAGPAGRVESDGAKIAADGKPLAFGAGFEFGPLVVRKPDRKRGGSRFPCHRKSASCAACVDRLPGRSRRGGS